jgi:hypothetical protein
MPVNKKYDEFYTLDMRSGWETPAGYPVGIYQKILSEDSRRGTRTRLLRFAPGVYTTAPFSDDARRTAEVLAHIARPPSQADSETPSRMDSRR